LFYGLLEAEAVPVAFYDMGAVCNPIQEGRGHVGGPQNVGPVREAQVGGDNHRSVFMPLGKDLEKQFGCLAVDLHMIVEAMGAGFLKKIQKILD
jgi:hypothetical protein